jgi:hypothetical protein
VVLGNGVRLRLGASGQVSDTWFCQLLFSSANRHESGTKVRQNWFAGCRSIGAGLEDSSPVGLNGTRQADERSLVKGQQKPKQLAKKAAQMTMKEKRQEKKAKKKAGGAFDH